MHLYLHFSLFAVDTLPFSTTENAFQKWHYRVVSTDHVFKEKYLQVGFFHSHICFKKAYIAGKL